MSIEDCLNTYIFARISSANKLSVTMLIIVASRVDPILPVRLKSQVCIKMYTSWFNRWGHVKL